MSNKRERRSALRTKIGKKAEFTYHQDFECEGRVENICEGGAAIRSDAPVSVGNIVMLRPEGMGRIPGEVVRVFEGGFAVSFILSKYERDAMKKRIEMAKQGVPYISPSENRCAPRTDCYIESSAKLEQENDPFDCAIVDFSSTGYRVQCARRPRVGSRLSVGALRGVVRRHTRDGFAVEFITSSAEEDVALLDEGGASIDDADNRSTESVVSALKTASK